MSTDTIRRPLPLLLGSDWGAYGMPGPLGATYIAERNAYNFALYSHDATGVTLLFYTAADLVKPAVTRQLDPNKNKTGRVWHCLVTQAELTACVTYAYSVDGPFNPAAGDRFLPQKVLLDPYAQRIVYPTGYSRDACKGAGPTAGLAPIAQIPTSRPNFDWGGDQHVEHTSDAIIYEMHVRGFTRRSNSGVPPAHQGTFAGVIDKIPYLQDLGITVVELMPVMEFDPEDGGNYWGYMSLNFFAPHHAYASSTDAADRADEFRAMVKALHAAKIEVIMDVVYNHTSEQGADGPTYSYRGIDNSTYYLLSADMSTYRDDTGCGNVFRTSHPAVRKLVLDSMRLWVEEMHVDGFRFDLASIFALNPDGSINTDDASIIDEMNADPAFAHTRLIAEPWDAAGAYQLGRSFPGKTWHQWNGQYRDDLRSFVKSDNGKIFAVMSRLYGSNDLFPDDLFNSNRPFQSINFITCHDGFCLYDLVSYQDKHNEANGQHNQDGSNSNLSWNCGTEGDNGLTPAILALRKRQIKNFFSLLMLSNGVPMFCAGDELMKTQGGNNNPYNQDNETSWLDWDKLTQNADMYRFFKQAIAFRKAHPSLCRDHFWRDDILWFGPNGPVDTSDSSHTLAFCLKGHSVNDNDIYLIANMYWQDISFSIGVPAAWKRVIDTALDSPDDIAVSGTEPAVAGNHYLARARSVVVLIS